MTAGPHDVGAAALACLHADGRAESDAGRYAGPVRTVRAVVAPERGGEHVASLFTKIIENEIPGVFVYEDERCAAFLDVQPMTEGHVLVVPREEIAHWVDLDDDLSAHLFAVAKRIARAQNEAFECEKVGLMIQGYEVPHVHIHVWPTTSLADFDASRRADFTDAAELEPAAEKIRKLL